MLNYLFALTSTTTKMSTASNHFTCCQQITGESGGSQTVSPGQVFTVTSFGHPETTFRIGGSATVTIHTSCSQPLNIGDQFGSLVVVGSNNCPGGPPPPPPRSCYDSLDQCPGCDMCRDRDYKPSQFTFQYVAGGPVLSNSQDGKAFASGATLSGTASVSCFGKSGGSIGGSAFVQPGGTFVVNAPDGNELRCTITASGAQQQMELHTSCSKPLNVGDQYGSLVIVAMQSRDKDTGRTVSSTDASFCPQCVLCCEMGEIYPPQGIVVEYRSIRIAFCVEILHVWLPDKILMVLFFLL